MYERYIIVENETKNTVEDGQTTGFQVGARLPYYRGLGISMVEDIQLNVDGKSIPSDQLRLQLHGNTYTLKAMETEPEDRWEFGEIGILKVTQPGGLSKGEHQIDLLFNIRVSYMPVNAMRAGNKTITV